jgi:cell wall assembly regulator SMI1
MLDTKKTPFSESKLALRSALGAWTFIEQVLAERHPALLADLRPGATDADLDCIEGELRVTLPEAFRVFYKHHDGQNGEAGAPGLFFGMIFLSLDEISAVCKSRSPSLGPDHAFYVVEAEPGPVVNTCLVRTGKLPFAKDHLGNLLGLDFSPGELGVIGQCISFGRDGRRPHVVAKSFEEFLVWIQSRMWPGTYAFFELEGFGPLTRNSQPR